MDANEIIRILDMQPHPEGGWYVETWRAGAAEPPTATAGRPSGSAICFLLAAGHVSAWHRLDATEIWHFYAGAPLELRTAAGDGGSAPVRRILGPTSVPVRARRSP